LASNHNRNLQPTARPECRYPKRTKLTTKLDTFLPNPIATLGHTQTIEGLLLQEQVDGTLRLVATLFGALVDQGIITSAQLRDALEADHATFDDGAIDSMIDRPLRAALAVFRGAAEAR
jgi:hypothetical protein